MSANSDKPNEMLWFKKNENRLNRSSNKTISITPLGNKDYSMYGQKMKNYDQKDVISLQKNNISNVKLSS
jgi:lipopolysaccharide export system protein LptC